MCALEGSPQSQSHVCAFDEVLLIFTVTDPTPETFPAPSIVPPLTPVKLNAAIGDPGGGSVVVPLMLATAPVRIGNSALAEIGRGTPEEVRQ